MIKFNYQTGNRPLIFEFKIVTSADTTLNIRVEDAALDNTVYTNREKDMKKGTTENFFIRMPQSPKIAVIKVWTTGNKNNFTIKSKEVYPLIAKMDKYDFGKKLAVLFILFAEEFVSKAGYTSAGIYHDDSGNFTIKYDSKITDAQNNRSLNTPARINAKSGIIQVSKDKFDKLTVPGRLAILLHEFAHVFANKNMRDEMEADFHAATIYLALGYPQVDLLNVFAQVFYKNDNKLNRERFKKLYQYARNFSNNVHKVQYKI